MLIGISFGLAACVLWGFTYLLPLLLPDYPTTYISVARGIVMGVTALAGLALQKQYLKQVNLKDWNTAFWLTLIGNLIQPWCLFSAVQYAGVALAATFFGLIPVLVALIANERDKRKGKKYLPLSKLILPLSVIFIGLILANFEGLINVLVDYKSNPNFLIGVIYSVLSTAMWTWYPIRNADWLLDHPKISPVFFTSMQCSLLLPFGIVLYVALWLFSGDLKELFGPSPFAFIGWSLFAGVVCSFGATALWNAMSQKVPTAVAGPMLVFETIFSVTWGCVYARAFPTATLFIGMVLLVSGVVYTLMLFNSLNEPVVSEAESSAGGM